MKGGMKAHFREGMGNSYLIVFLYRCSESLPPPIFSVTCFQIETKDIFRELICSGAIGIVAEKEFNLFSTWAGCRKNHNVTIQISIVRQFSNLFMISTKCLLITSSLVSPFCSNS